jgi:hypothetical protein
VSTPAIPVAPEAAGDTRAAGAAAGSGVPPPQVRRWRRGRGARGGGGVESKVLHGSERGDDSDEASGPLYHQAAPAKTVVFHRLAFPVPTR